MKTEKYKSLIAAFRLLADKLEECDAAENSADKLRSSISALNTLTHLNSTKGGESILIELPSASQMEQVTLTIEQMKELFPDLIAEEKQ